MTARDLDAVLAIEARCYGFPWTRGNFIDALAAGYLAEVLPAPRGGLVGYFVALAGAGEMHLLNLSVAPSTSTAAMRARCSTGWKRCAGRSRWARCGWRCAKATIAPAPSTGAVVLPRSGCGATTTPPRTASASTRCS
jgi:[ribosomal protein S18]-alanine N-acetyltransferase